MLFRALYYCCNYGVKSPFDTFKAYKSCYNYIKNNLIILELLRSRIILSSLGVFAMVFKSYELLYVDNISLFICVSNVYTSLSTKLPSVQYLLYFSSDVLICYITTYLSSVLAVLGISTIGIQWIFISLEICKRISKQIIIKRKQRMLKRIVRVVQSDLQLDTSCSRSVQP